MFGKNKKPHKKAAAKVQKNARLDENFVPITIKTHKDKNGGHPHAIMDDIDDNHVSVGFTHDKYKGNSKKSGKNYTLECNPLGGNKQSFMRRQGTVAPKGEYEQPRKGKLSKKDFEQATIYAERAKLKYITEKKGKKK